MGYRSNRQYEWNAGNTILNLVIFVAVIFLLFWVARSVFTILSWLAPFMLIVAAVLDYKVIIQYLKTIVKWLRHKTLFGVLAVIFTIFGFPLVSAYLLFRAYLSYQQKKSVGQREPVEQFIEYEEVEDEFLELPDLEKREKGH